MKDRLKDPMTYTIAVPIIAGLWMLYAWLMAYPAAQTRYAESYQEYQEGQKLIEQILALEPQRLSYKQEKGKTSEFDYTNVISDFARQHGIAPDDYTLVVRGATKRAGRTVKSADMSIKQIDIEDLSKFISVLLQRWTDLECERLSIDNAGTGKNNWKVTLRFTYTY